VLLTLLTAPSSAQTLESSVTGSPAGQDTPPRPQHTGWKSLAKDTVKDIAIFPQRKSTWLFLAGGAVAALAVHPADDDVQRALVGNERAEDFFVVGKWVGSFGVQTGTAVGLWAVGRWIIPPGPDGSRTNKVSHLGFDLLRAEILSQLFAQSIKHVARRDRPTGECCSFPSGHATNAFAFASVLERHFGRRGWWPALAMATYVATSRLVDNRHFLSDVAFGAALGEAIGWTVVGRHGGKQFALQPVPVSGGLMLAVVRQEPQRP
jgi:membrane-associated phospholipid phosphatase